MHLHRRQAEPVDDGVADALLALQERMVAIGQKAWIDRQDLYRVRIGPFATRDQAVSTRAALEASGVSAMIVTE